MRIKSDSVSEKALKRVKISIIVRLRKSKNHFVLRISQKFESIPLNNQRNPRALQKRIRESLLLKMPFSPA